MAETVDAPRSLFDLIQVGHNTPDLVISSVFCKFYDVVTENLWTRYDEI